MSDESGTQIVSEEQTTSVLTENVNTQEMSGDSWGQMKNFFTDEINQMVDELFNFDISDTGIEDGSEASSDESQLDSTKGGSCSKKVVGVDGYQCSDGQCHKTPETPKYKMEIEKNDLPENWWDKLPDFDPRVYDAISLEQASACVSHVFDTDIPELEHKMMARAFRKTCPKTKVQVPRTSAKKPNEIRYDTKIDDFIKKDETY